MEMHYHLQSSHWSVCRELARDSPGLCDNVAWREPQRTWGFARESSGLETIYSQFRLWKMLPGLSYDTQDWLNGCDAYLQSVGDT